MKEIKTKILTAGKSSDYKINDLSTNFKGQLNKCCCNAFRNENCMTFINFSRLQSGGKKIFGKIFRIVGY